MQSDSPSFSGMDSSLAGTVLQEAEMMFIQAVIKIV